MNCSSPSQFHLNFKGPVDNNELERALSDPKKLKVKLKKSQQQDEEFTKGSDSDIEKSLLNSMNVRKKTAGSVADLGPPSN